MTLQYLLEQTEGANITQIPIFANNECVYDYKESKDCIKLIHNENCYNLEQITLYEILKYAEECNLAYSTTFISSETSGEYFTSATFTDYKLNLKY